MPRHTRSDDTVSVNRHRFIAAGFIDLDGDARRPDQPDCGRHPTEPPAGIAFVATASAYIVGPVATNSTAEFASIEAVREG